MVLAKVKEERRSELFLSLYAEPYLFYYMLPITVQPDDGAIEQILRNTQDINLHTATSFWHSGVPEIIFDTITLLAAIIALFACGKVYLEYRKIQKNKNYRKLIFQDFVRHLYVNDVVADIVLMKLKSRNFEGCYPHERIMPRFKFTESDLDLNRFSVTTKSYEKIHSFMLFLRNYNVSAEATALHLADTSLDPRIKIADIEDLHNRSGRIIERLFKIGEDLELNLDPVDKIIYANYENRSHIISKEEVELNKAEMAIPGIMEIGLPHNSYPKAMEKHYRKAVAERYLTPNDIDILPY